MANLTYPNYEIILVDDCSTDDTQSFLRTYQESMKSILVLHNERNRGAAFSRNRGVAHARGEIIVFVDDDVSLFPDCLNELVKLYTEDPNLMVVWGCVYQYGNSSWNEGEQTFGTGSLWSLRRLVFKQFRFDTNLRYFGTPACDEHDLARRIQKQGFKIIKAETVQANHFHAHAQNRSFRGLGGDLNFLYEKLRSGSLIEYYACFVLGILLILKRLFVKSDFDEFIPQHPYRQMIATPYRVLGFLKHFKFDIAGKWLFYTLVDIPVRAKTRGLVDWLARTYSPNWPA
jgi:GT2 family glycosyltransferase